MNKQNIMNTKEIAAYFGISKPTLCRWVSRGCPHRKIANRQVFCLAKVEEWINTNLDSENSNRLKSQRSLKRYHLFSVSSQYLGEVLGSKALTDRLKEMESYDHHYPFGVDDYGYVYFFYSGKLRKHESVKTMAGVKVSTRYPENLQALMDIVYKRYISTNFRLRKESGGISSP